MTTLWTPTPSGRRADLPVAEGELDEDLAKLVRRTSWLRQGFYFVVLVVALAGQVSGAVEALHIPLLAAIPAVAALELGGIVVLANADVRRRLGERAHASRLLSAAIAASAVAFNWLAHSNHLLGGFFAGMSALGYLVWLMHTENQRRDRLRVKGDLPPTTPAYELVGHWFRHPWLTIRARAMAKADHRLGLYDSVAAARAEVRRERREAAIAKVLHRKIRSAVDPRTADIAIAVYDLDEIAARLAKRADYDGLTSIIAADLAPHRLAPNGVLEQRPSARTKTESGGRANTPAAANTARFPVEFSDIDLVAEPDATVETPMLGSVPAQRTADRSTRRGTAARSVVLPPDLRQDLERRLGGARDAAQRPTPALDETDRLWDDPAAADISLRRRVHAALDAAVHSADQRDDTELIGKVFDELDLSDLERLSAASYVRSWRLETESGQRIRSA